MALSVLHFVYLHRSAPSMSQPMRSESSVSAIDTCFMHFEKQRSILTLNNGGDTFFA